MSSIPLPRILHTKKSSDEVEKEQFDKQMVSAFSENVNRNSEKNTYKCDQ